MNLETLQSKNILMFGKPRAFSHEEFEAQLLHHKLTLVREYSEDISLIVDGKMMTPYEQNLSDELYEAKKIAVISIDELEKILASKIDTDVLLMSLKLSHNKERLKSFIQNPCIPDSLFFKLLKMYSWGGEDFFENDDNRDVSAAFISRFYENIERNHNVEYATTGFIHLVAQSKKREILEAITYLEPLSFHPKIMMAIAMSIYTDEKMQKRLHKKRDTNIDEALSYNKNLSKILIEKFLDDEKLAHNIAKNILLDNELFEKLQEFKVSLAANTTLNKEMQNTLYKTEDNMIKKVLASNSNLDRSLLLLLLESGDKDILSALYLNRATPQNILQESYERGEYYDALAQNENTPVDILYQLQLDSRYERHVKTNAAFGKHIQSENIGWMV